MKNVFHPYWSAEVAVNEQRRYRFAYLLSLDVLNRTILDSFIHRVSESVKVNKNWILIDPNSVLGTHLTDIDDYWWELIELLGYTIQTTQKWFVISWGVIPNTGAMCQCCRNLIKPQGETNQYYSCRKQFGFSIGDITEVRICSFYKANGDPFPEVHHRGMIYPY